MSNGASNGGIAPSTAGGDNRQVAVGRLRQDDGKEAFVSGSRSVGARRVLALSAVLEIGTGLVLLVSPGVVSALLLGVDVSGVGIAFGRCFGITLSALGIACWPSPLRGDGNVPALRAMLVYNPLVALYLAFLGISRHMDGVLLWPGVALHAAVALALVWTSRDG